MSAPTSPRAPRARQSRKSIAHLPSKDLGGDKENATMDSAAITSISAQSKEKLRKTRSKSVGPGGIDALREGSGNKGEPPPRPFVKSILKTTSVFSPPKFIPPRSSSKASPGRGPTNSATNSPQKSPSRKSPKGVAQSPSRQLSTRSTTSPARSPSRLALRTEEEQQEAARERESQEKQAQKEARRKSLAKRRVSFAPEATLHTWNVVELPEDSTTSSASTNSTRRASNLTSGRGTLFDDPRSSAPSSDPSEPPSTPPEQVEELQVAASPAHQRDLHQRKRRRSSTIPPSTLNDSGDLSSSPTSIASDDSGPQTFENVDEEIDSSDSDDKDLEEDETVTAVDGDDSTIHSTGESSTNSSARLDAALQQAAGQASTQGIAYDENGDMSMEMADDEITNAFKPWAARTGARSDLARGESTFQDQENVNPFISAPRQELAEREDVSDKTQGDRTMEMTKAIGGILPTSEAADKSSQRKRRGSLAGRRRSSVARGMFSGADSPMAEDDTMDLTMPLGGIQENEAANSPRSVGADNEEELTMEFTSAIGGFIQQKGNPEHSTNQSLNRQESADESNLKEADMDMTYAAGGILAPITETTEPIEDQSMDMTAAIGDILPQELSTGNKAEAKVLMEREADVGQLSASPFGNRSPQKIMGAGLHDERPLPTYVYKVAMASETGSPSLASPQTQASARKSSGTRKSMTPKATENRLTPKKSPGTPSKQLTPQVAHPKTPPGKTPPSKNVTMRSASPKKLFKKEINAAAKHENKSTAISDSHNPLFSKDSSTGTTTPSIILKPRKRRSSGLGADKEGLGSPRVSELLDRRGSLGEKTKMFVPHGNTGSNVRFENPQIMEQEIEQERRDEERRENGRRILQGEADEQDVEGSKDVTANLKDMIGSLTPQKKKLKGRKSLHVGAAKGLLGKRPKELDEEDNDEDSTKRLKGREGSPVKQVRLPGPPPKSTTTGRVTRSNRKSLAEIDGNTEAGTPSISVSPSKNNTTPKDQTRFKDAERGTPAQVQSFEAKLEGTTKIIELPEEEVRIHLQDFLNMINIRFIELNTTKRRHTVVPGAANDPNAATKPDETEHGRESEAKSDLERCVVAGTCTVPMLELYQHSCRELKNYISEGRSIVKEIEADTYEDNPPLFREYVSAPADVKPIMDNQFKNVKTHARLLSKAMWYEWRMKLLEGLREGLSKIGDELEQDHLCLTQQEQIIQPVLPDLIEQHEELENQATVAQAQADELADCDLDELKRRRQDLLEVNDDLQEKQRLVEELQEQLREKEDRLEAVLARKHEYAGEIEEAEKTLQECRGWDSSEVETLQANVASLEATHGWSTTSVDDTAMAMTYAQCLQLFFTPACFLPNNPTSSTSPAASSQPISLTYISDSIPSYPSPLTTEKRFFLQIMRAHLQCLPQNQTRIVDLLSYVSRSWTVACAVAEEVRVLGIGFITEATIAADEVMNVNSTVLLPAMRTKVDVSFEVKVHNASDPSQDDSTDNRPLTYTPRPLDVSITPTARVRYGESLKEDKMADFLNTRLRDFRPAAASAVVGNGPKHMENNKTDGGSAKGSDAGGGGSSSVVETGVWAKAVRELEDRCLARGKK